MALPSASVSQDAFLSTISPLNASCISAIHDSATSGCITTGTRAVATGRAPRRLARHLLEIGEVVEPAARHEARPALLAAVAVVGQRHHPCLDAAAAPRPRQAIRVHDHGAAIAAAHQRALAAADAGIHAE